MDDTAPTLTAIPRLPQPPAKVRMTLVGRDGNALALLGAFRRTASEQGWPEDAIDAVSHEAMSGTYEHLLATLSDHITGEAQDDDKGEDDG